MPYADPIVRKQKSREAYLRRITDPDYVRRMNEYQGARSKLPEVKARLKAAHKRRYADPEYRARMLKANYLWFKEHPEENRKGALRWRHRNLDRARAATKEWFKNNVSKRRAYDREKRARKANATINPRSIEVFMAGVKAKRSAVCYYCQRSVSTKAIHFDHIIALSKGGAHSVENLCVACAKCNMTKSAKRLRDFVTLGQQILEL